MFQVEVSLTFVLMLTNHLKFHCKGLKLLLHLIIYCSSLKYVNERISMNFTKSMSNNFQLSAEQIFFSSDKIESRNKFLHFNEQKHHEYICY